MISPELQARSFRPYMPDTFSPSTEGRRSLTLNPMLSSFSSSTSSPNSNSGSSSSRSRFSASSFSHNYRIAIALLPCAAFLLDLGGAPVAGTLILGLMISYILDSMNLKPGAFFAVWFSLIVSQLAFFFSAFTPLSIAFNGSIFLTCLASLLCAFTTFLLGAWASIQFRWVQLESPSIILALERILFSCLPFAASSIFAWATISALGMTPACSYYLMFFNCLFYWLYGLPRASSFKSRLEATSHGGEVREENLILSPMEGCVQTLNLLFSPLLFHIASHHSIMLSSTANVSDLFLLFFIPLLFLLYASTRGGLWWLTKDARQIHSIRVVNGAISMIVVVICLEIRVIFHSFERYIQVSPPWNYGLVTVTMLGGAGGGAAFMLGMVSDAASARIFIALSMIVSTAGAIVVGFPVLLLPLPSAAGFFLAYFFTKKSLTSYFTFFILGSMMVGWFVFHNFWDLNIWLAGMSLRSFCKIIAANVVLAMAIPGLTLLPSKLSLLAEFGLIGQAVLLCHIENRFFSYSGVYYYGMEEEVMYPSYMVMLTSFVGLVLVRRLYADQRLGDKSVWFLTCLYSSKISLLFMSSRSVVWASTMLLLAVSPPLLLYKDKTKVSSKMKPWQGYFHAGIVAISVLICHETIFEALQWWNGKSPSDGLFLGFCILLAGLACIPIVALHFSHAMKAKRYLALVVATGVLLILIQPPIRVSWAYQSDIIKAARQSSDDISIYGFVTSKPTWPSWLLIVAILLTLSSITSIIPIKYVVELRAFYAIAMGIVTGIYISAEFFLQTAVLQVLIVVTMVSTSFFVIFTHFPSASSTKLLPWVFALLVALFPVTYLLEGQMRIKTLIGDYGAVDMAEEDNKFKTLLAVEGARTSLLGLYAAIFMLIALEIKFELTSLIKDKALQRSGIRSGNSGQTAVSKLAPRMRFMQQRRAATAPSFSIKRMAAEGAWMPAVGNVATIMCFGICLILNVNLTGGSNHAIFFLAPILLVLNQDSEFVAGFGDKQRYFPVAVAISAYLVLTTLYKIWEEIWNGNTGWGLDVGGPDWFFAVKNLALLILPLPSHILFNRFVWSYSNDKNSMPIITLPLNLPSIIISDVSAIRILGLLGVVYSVSQYLISRQQYISGMKYI